MPSKADAWARAWGQIQDRDVLDGPLTGRAGPSWAARKNLFLRLFPQLTPELIATRQNTRQLSHEEYEEILTAVAESSEQIHALSLLCAFVKNWFTATSVVGPLVRGTSKVEDIVFKDVKDLLEAKGGLDQVEGAGGEAVEAWLRERYHLDDDDMGGLPVDPPAVRQYLYRPEVTARLERELADAWASTPRTAAGDAPLVTPPWVVGVEPTPELRARLEAAARTDLASIEHDRLCRQLGLTTTPADTALAAPVVLSRQERRKKSGDGLSEASYSRYPKPLDRSLERRLRDGVDAGDKAPDNAKRLSPEEEAKLPAIIVDDLAEPFDRPHHDGETRATVREAVAAEVARSAQPLGLAVEENRWAFVAGAAAVRTLMWLDDMTELQGLADKAGADAEWVAGVAALSAHFRRYLPGYLREGMLSRPVREALHNPPLTFGPRLWSRLHNAERDGRRLDPFAGIRDAWSSWVKDLRSYGWDFVYELPDHETLQQHSIVGGAEAPVDETDALGSEVNTAEAFALLSERRPTKTRAFARQVMAGTATERQWRALIRETELAEGHAYRNWPSFADVQSIIERLGESEE